MTDEFPGVHRLIVKFKDQKAADLTWPFVSLDKEIKCLVVDNQEYVLKVIEHDSVSKPDHYTSSTIECIDAIKAQLTHEQFVGYLRGNVIKYVWRYEQKGGIEDLRKALVYLEWLIKEVEDERADG